jgi:uncharacterized protein (TIGR02301 family)
MASMQSWRYRLYGVALAACMLGAFALQPASASPQRWYRWEQNLLDLSEILGTMHYLGRLCGSPYDQLWRDRMIVLLEEQAATGERYLRLVSRFNEGHDGTRRWYDRCSPAARFKIEQTSLLGDNLIVWFSVNSPY